jgi:hypothetical protein
MTLQMTMKWSYDCLTLTLTLFLIIRSHFINPGPLKPEKPILRQSICTCTEIYFAPEGKALFLISMKIGVNDLKSIYFISLLSLIAICPSIREKLGFYRWGYHFAPECINQNNYDMSLTIKLLFNSLFLLISKIQFTQKQKLNLNIECLKNWFKTLFISVEVHFTPIGQTRGPRDTTKVSLDSSNRVL